MRTLTRILILLLAGAFISFASAWAMEFRLVYSGVSPARPVREFIVRDAATSQPLDAAAFRGTGYREYHLMWDVTDGEALPTPGPSSDVPAWVQRPEPDFDHRSGSIAYGFPFPCVKWDYTTAPGKPDHFNHMLPFKLSSRDNARLPLRPVFPAFLLSSLLYSMLLSPIALARPLRRHLRLRRGHCPSCNYDLAHDFTHPCPECGQTAQT